MTTKQMIGIGLLVISGAVAYMGYRESEGIVSTLSSVFESIPRDSVMIKYVAAGVLAVAGIFLIKK